MLRITIYFTLEHGIFEIKHSKKGVLNLSFPRDPTWLLSIIARAIMKPLHVFVYVHAVEGHEDSSMFQK